MSILAMKQALEALESDPLSHAGLVNTKQAITALRQAIAEAEKQERVDETAKREHEFKEMVKRGTKAWADTPDDWVDELRGGAEKREWVGLTDDEWVEELGKVREQVNGDVFGGFYRAIEAKLKEKNT